MEEIKEFMELGLTKNELKVYQALLEHGKLGASEISRFSGASYSRIYDVLASLEQKGFVKIIPEKSKKFVPIDPQALFEIIEKKKKGLDDLKVHIKKMKQLYENKEKNPVLLGFGKPAFYKLLKEMQEVKKTDYSVKWSSEIRPDWMNKVERRLKNGVDIKELVRYDRETEKNVKEWLKVNKNLRKIENNGVAISIKDDDEVLISLIKSNMTLLVRDRPFTKVMKHLFLETYKHAEEIK